MPYPDKPNVTTRRVKTAGFVGKMVGENESGPWQEDAIACGSGQATERMGTGGGKADSALTKGLFGARMKTQR